MVATTAAPSGGASTSAADSEKAEKRKKKKSFYAKLKRQEDDKMAELAAKYRDRAKERRDGHPGHTSLRHVVNPFNVFESLGNLRAFFRFDGVQNRA